MKVYHSALKKELSIQDELDFYQTESIVFRHDICGNFPKYYSDCDVLYAEPAWLDGYFKFMDRADHERTTYEEYLDALTKIINHWNRPLWLIIGSHALKKLPVPERMEKIILYGYPTNLIGWNDTHNYRFKTNYDFIEKLAERYDRVGDFCCGYGNTGKIFSEHQKSFVMSDINGKCVFYIAKNLMGYKHDSIH